METLALLVGILLCVTVVNCRSFEERQELDLLSDIENQGQEKHGSERHRKRRWQNYGYDNPRPYPNFYPDRREYDNQDLLPKIVKLLEDISYHVRRPQPPPPPPQPIYIPYPVPYYIPQYVAACKPANGNSPNVTSRFPDLEDMNQNWGFVLNEKDNIPIPGNGVRPISFDPLKPIKPTQRPSPGVEHGTQQKENQHTTSAPNFGQNTGASGRSPDRCNAAILSCCTGDENSLKECFSNFYCGMFLESDRLCSSESINNALEAFKVAYSPM